MAELRGITFDLVGTLEHLHVPINGLRDGLEQLRDEEIEVGLITSAYELVVRRFLEENGVIELINPEAIFGRNSVRTYLEEHKELRKRNFIGKALKFGDDPLIEIVPVTRPVPPKPSPAAMEFLLEQLWKFKLNEVIHVGDDIFLDQNFAVNAGVAFLRVNPFLVTKSLPDLIEEAKTIVERSEQESTSRRDG